MALGREPQPQDPESDTLTLELEALNLELDALDLEPHIQPDDPDVADPDAEDPDADDGDLHVAGRIVHDEKGNARWKWRGETGSTGTDSGILKYIDPADLSVEGSEPPQPGGKATGKPAGASDAGGGYDPYNQGKAQSRNGPPGKTGHNKR